MPELASTHFLVQRVGFGRASEMCLSGRLYGAAEAHAMGLADHLCAPVDLEARAFEIAGEIAKNPDPQLRIIKELLGPNGTDTDLGTVQERETAAKVRSEEEQLAAAAADRAKRAERRTPRGSAK